MYTLIMMVSEKDYLIIIQDYLTSETNTTYSNYFLLPFLFISIMV